MRRMDLIKLLDEDMRKALDEYERLRNNRSTRSAELDAAWNRIKDVERLRFDLYDLYRRNT